MSNTIKLKHTNKGIGVNFYNDTEEKHYKEIIETIKPLVPSNISLGLSDVQWDLDNLKLGHKNPEADNLLKKITLKIEQ